MVQLRDVVSVLDSLYDPAWAADWDAVGTVAGDPSAGVVKILFAVDPVQAVADEAIAWGADLVVTHHPLYLKGVTSVAATTPKGKVLHALISRGVALHTCHTNADSPPGGVSASMATALGLTEVKPLQPDPADPVDCWVVHVPEDDADTVSAAMFDAGAGAIGAYDRCVFASSGAGSFRPLDGAQPVEGRVGVVTTGPQARLELVADRRLRSTVRQALLTTHPYEVPAYQVLEVAAADGERGSGRIGELAEAVSLADFARHVASALPAHHGATRVAGDPDRPIRTVALCGGSGDFLLGAATAAGADVFVTSDLRHHPVSEHLEGSGAAAVIDVPHWAAEWTWLPVAARAVADAFERQVQTRVSNIVTDPWTFNLVQG